MMMRNTEVVEESDDLQSTVNLQYLHNLTHSRIDRAIEDVFNQMHSGTFRFYNDVNYLDKSSYHRLDKLIDADIQDADSLKGGLLILAALLHVHTQEIQVNSTIVKAVKIFIKFKIHGNVYITTDGKQTTCLHDALECESFRNDLTVLLIQNGADIDQENDEHLTALAVLMIQEYDKDFLHILFAHHEKPIEKLMFAMACVMDDVSKKSWPILQASVLYDVFNKHPGFLNLNCGLEESPTTILHIAAENRSAEVVDFLLSNGADPDKLNVDRCKPIHVAVERAMDKENSSFDELNEAINIITYLLLNSLKRSLAGNVLTANHIVDELFNLDLVEHGYRAMVCNSLFSLDHKQIFNFTEKELLYSLNVKRLECTHAEIDFYRTSIIGSGGYAVVYKGKWEDNNRLPVAIKLHEKDPGDHTMRFEAEIHSRLQHPNIIQYMGTLERYGFFGIYMQRAKHKTLAHFIIKGSKAVVRDLFYTSAKQMIAGLRYLHSQGYVHLDFKSGNILLDGNQLLIADFGSAARSGERRSYVVTTSWYCSPEQFYACTPYQYANDIFSYGVILGEMDTQETPWPVKTKDTFVKEKICEGQRATFNDKKMSVDVAKLVQLCWQQDPEDRPDCEEIDGLLEVFKCHY